MAPSDDEGEELRFDSLCAICDNGGLIICCEGKCFRSFHVTPDSEGAEDSHCQSLCRPPDQVGPFRCENCLYRQHQCFICGKLGSSGKSSRAEVFRCSSATCGHFYHPKCVANLLQPTVEEAEHKNLLEKIAAGEPFICPAHRCNVCKQTENKKVEDLQFAVCRRCPTSYHRKCLPRNIIFASQAGDGDIVRAWDGLLPKSRAAIYCFNHDIEKDLGTPARTLIFSNIRKIKMDKQSKLPMKKKKVADTSKNSLATPSEMDKQSKLPIKKKKVADTSKNSLATPSKMDKQSKLPMKRKKVADTSKNFLVMRSKMGKHSKLLMKKKKVADTSNNSRVPRVFLIGILSLIIICFLQGLLWLFSYL